MRLLTTLAVLAITAAPAFAGVHEAEKCAAGLDPSSQKIFAAVLPQVTPAADLKVLVPEATKALVKSGQVPLANAKPAAMAAGGCLKLAKK